MNMVNQSKREGVFGEKVFPMSHLLCQEPLQLNVIKGAAVVWSKESGLLQIWKLHLLTGVTGPATIPQKN